MKPEELYKKEFGNAESIPKESVIRLLRHFAKALDKGPGQPKEEKPPLPESESDLPKTNLYAVAQAFHKRAKAKGFWDEKRETGTLLMLIVSELSEALEADRKGKYANMEKYHQGIVHGELFETYIKDTFEDEIADVFIRLLDLCGAMGVDIDKHIELKMKYNQARDYKHGKAY